MIEPIGWLDPFFFYLSLRSSFVLRIIKLLDTSKVNRDTIAFYLKLLDVFSK